jgi:hypothetical protein
MSWIESIIIFIALVFNFIFNYLINKKTLSSNFNKIVYLIVWFGTAIVLFILRYSSSDSLSLTSLFYATVAFSYPQAIVSLLAIKDYEKDRKELEEKFDKIKDLIKTVLAFVDAPDAIKLLAEGKSIKDVEGVYKQRMEDYVNYGFLPTEKGKEYLSSVLYLAITSKRGASASKQDTNNSTNSNISPKHS